MICKYCGGEVIGSKCKACGREAVLADRSHDLEKWMQAGDGSFRRGYQAGYEEGFRNGEKEAVPMKKTSESPGPAGTGSVQAPRKGSAVGMLLLVACAAIVCGFLSGLIGYRMGNSKGYDGGFAEGFAEGHNNGAIVSSAEMQEQEGEAGISEQEMLDKLKRAYEDGKEEGLKVGRKEGREEAMKEAEEALSAPAGEAEQSGPETNQTGAPEGEQPETEMTETTETETTEPDNTDLPDAEQKETETPETQPADTSAGKTIAPARRDTEAVPEGEGTETPGAEETAPELPEGAEPLDELKQPMTGQVFTNG